jgi:hypothetical protein
LAGIIIAARGADFHMMGDFFRRMQKGMQNGESHMIGRKGVPRQMPFLRLWLLTPAPSVHAVYKSVHPLQQKYEYIQRDSIGMPCII